MYQNEKKPFFVRLPLIAVLHRMIPCVVYNRILLSHIITVLSTNEDPSLRIKKFAIINIRVVPTKSSRGRRNCHVFGCGGKQSLQDYKII